MKQKFPHILTVVEFFKNSMQTLLATYSSIFLLYFYISRFPVNHIRIDFIACKFQELALMQ